MMSIAAVRISAGDVTWVIPQVTSPAEIITMAVDVIGG